MGRIEARFASLSARGQSAFIPFLMAGDPDLRATVDLALLAGRAGADALEIGVPFSDPMADGPVLQRSAERALKKGVSLSSILDVVKEVRRNLEIPIILFGYCNPIHRYGQARLVRDAREAGIDALLCVDLPPEEAGELKAATDSADLDLIFLLAPTTSEARARFIATAARGFLYLVSITGVTGARMGPGAELECMVKKLKKLTDLPLAVGFGIDSPKQAARVARVADAVICGSAVMRLVEACARDRDAMRGPIGKFLSSMAASVHGARRKAGG